MKLQLKALQALQGSDDRDRLLSLSKRDFEGKWMMHVAHDHISHPLSESAG